MHCLAVMALFDDRLTRTGSETEGQTVQTAICMPVAAPGLGRRLLHRLLPHAMHVARVRQQERRFTGKRAVRAVPASLEGYRTAPGALVLSPKGAQPQIVGVMTRPVQIGKVVVFSKDVAIACFGLLQTQDRTRSQVALATADKAGPITERGT